MESSCVCTYFGGQRADSFGFDITDSQFIAISGRSHKTIEIPPCLTAPKVQEIKYKIIIKIFSSIAN